MPTYVFRCPVHGDIEVEHAMNVPHPKLCPVCGNEIKRVYSPTPAKFVGEGWTGARGNTMRSVKTDMTSPESEVPYH